MNLAGIVNFGKDLGYEFLGLGRNIIENKHVYSALNVLGIPAGTAIATIYGTLWFCKNNFAQEVEFTKKAAEPVQEVESVESIAVKKCYVMKAKPVQKAEPVKEVKKYYVKKQDESITQDKPVQKGAEKSSQEVVNVIMDKLQESYPGMAFEVKYVGPVALAGADADTV
jgi:hypothetical protein